MLDWNKKEKPFLSYGGFGGGSTGLVFRGATDTTTYVDDVFSTFVYTGTGSNQTVTNGIDLAGEGGLVWLKNRDASSDHRLLDTERGAGKVIYSSTASQEATETNTLTSFNSNGFTTGGYLGSYDFASWTFRKAPGFFDIVTYTSQNGVSAINHNLGTVPGCIMIKKMNGGTSWQVYHRSTGATKRLELDGNNGASTNSAFANTAPTDTQFFINPASNDTFGTVGDQFVAYLWAHDEATFGENEDESIIKCGSYTGSGSVGKTVNLGFEPQWMLVKSMDATRPWVLIDVMRGMPRDGNGVRLLADDSAGDVTSASFLAPTPTGFEVTQQNTYVNVQNENYLYIAIRRPHKPPSAGTDVFGVVTRSGVNATANASSNASRFTDMVFTKNRGSGNSSVLSTRLQGQGAWATDSRSGEDYSFWSSRLFWDEQSGVRYAQYDQVNQSGSNYIDYFFTRAKGCFDVAAYTGTGSAGLNVPHGLGVTPEMMWIKKRTTTSGGDAFQIYHSSQGNGKYSPFSYDPFYTSGARWNNTSPTSTQFTLGSDGDVNENTHQYIAMLFATLPGISKVGSYTGTGSSQNIDCGFTSGARFVMIKRADTEVQNPVEDRTNWYVWDSARGIVSGNDPWIALNRAEAENTSTDWIDPLNSGFTVSHTGGSVNANGGTYIFLAFA